MKRRISPALTLAAFLIAASPQLFARDKGAPATGGGAMPDATAPSSSTLPSPSAPSDSRVSPDRDTATSPSYDRMDEGTTRDKKTRKSKERNPNAATPATPATPADPQAGTPAVPATPATPSNRETTP